MERNDKFLQQCDRCDKVHVDNRKRKSVISDDMVVAKEGTKGKETEDPRRYVLLFVC